MTGKEKCSALRAIREKIARENELSYPTDECHHQGKCSGTCPRCEQELADLTRQLERRKSLGKRVAVAGLCLGMAASLSACAVIEDVIDQIRPTAPLEDLDGYVVCPDLDPTDIDELTGEIDVYMTEEPYELEGDVPYIPEEAEIESTPEEASGEQ